jgi:hypothetical protein
MADQVEPHEPSQLEVSTIQVHQTLNDSSVARRWGAFRLKGIDQKRRVVWVRVTSPLEAPKQGNGQQQNGETGQRFGLACIRVQNVDAHVYAETEARCDHLLKQVMAAIAQTVPQHVFISEDWPLETEENASSTRYAKAVLRVQFRLTVANVIQPLRLVAGEGHECGILQADGSINSS